MAAGANTQSPGGHGKKQQQGRSQQSAQQNVMSGSAVSTGGSLLFPLQFTYGDEGPEVRIGASALLSHWLHRITPSQLTHTPCCCPQRGNDASTSDQYDPVLELQKIQRALAGLTPEEQQVRVCSCCGCPPQSWAAALELAGTGCHHASHQSITAEGELVVCCTLRTTPTPC